RGVLEFSWIRWDGGSPTSDDIEGSWVDDTGEIKFDHVYDGNRDSYSGFANRNPVTGIYGLAGILDSSDDSGGHEFSGWYALAEESFDPDDSGFALPTAQPSAGSYLPEGPWQLITGGSWGRLVLHIGAADALTGDLLGSPLHGTWDSALQGLTFQVDSDPR